MTIESAFPHPKQRLKISHDGLGHLCTLHVQGTPHRIFRDFVDERQWKVLVNSPEEHQSEQPTEVELEEVSGR